MPALHHIELCVSVSDARVRNFYDAVLGGLGFSSPHPNLYAKDELLVLLTAPKEEGGHRRGAVGLHHLAFAVDSRAEVDRFYREVLLALEGVEVEDPPVDCPEYGYEEYYATFFYDFDGIKLEVVHSRPGNEGRF